MTGHRLTVTDVGEAVRIGCTCTHQGALIPIESDPTHRADIWRTRGEALFDTLHGMTTSGRSFCFMEVHRRRIKRVVRFGRRILGV